MWRPEIDASGKTVAYLEGALQYASERAAKLAGRDPEGKTSSLERSALSLNEPNEEAKARAEMVRAGKEAWRQPLSATSTVEQSPRLSPVGQARELIKKMIADGEKKQRG